MNRPLQQQGVATTKDVSSFGSSPERVATSINIPNARKLDFFHHPKGKHSSMENVLMWLDHALEETSREHAADAKAGSGVIFSLDYDGTLAPAGMPHSTTRPSPGIQRAIEKLINSGAEVWLTSGKDIHGLRELLPIEGVKYCGLFGLEYDPGDGVRYHPEIRESHHEAVSSVYGILNNQFDSDRFPGIEVECQGSLLTMDPEHDNTYQRMLVTTLVWKGCDEQFDMHHAIETVRGIAEEHGLRINVGHGYVNVLPFFPGKGEAVRKIVSGTSAEPTTYDFEPRRKTLISIGDEEPDVDAFNAAIDMYHDGTLASFMNLGVTHPEYEKIVKDVYGFGPAQENGVRTSERRKVFLETGEHHVDGALSLYGPDGNLSTDHMVLPGPSGVARFLTLAARRLDQPFIKPGVSLDASATVRELGRGLS